MSGLIDEGQKGALRRDREGEMPWRIAQPYEARESIVRRIRDTKRNGKQDE